MDDASADTATLAPDRPPAPDAGTIRPAIDGDIHAVQSLLASQLARQRRRAERLSAEAARLWRRLESTVPGGKMTRPRLVALGFDAFGGGDREPMHRLACAFELLHAALLIHDDVIDRDVLRRGNPTVGASYAERAAAQRAPHARHAGDSVAIIAGDLLLAAAVRLAADAVAGRREADDVLDAFHGAVEAAAAGELEDVLLSWGDEPAPLADVLRMERLKTAYYSFEAPLRAGALLAGADPVAAAALAAVGRELGAAYQIADDVLGTFGHPGATGKPSDSDLREGKSTVLTALAVQDPEAASLLRADRDARRRGEDPDPAAAKRALQASGAPGEARRIASALCRSALDRAAGLKLPSGVVLEIERLGALVMQRCS
ncbi:polyprenyl synthetase family protein [Zafaria sp. J156]|uniref:polyprenyl synthetase family protein n=1 Tax=Zafaria sp. J156 TaxID=3116490 RepID=UPI002E796156|nr:polyprenyl synthetase family protein [Zafaria sp. J156]MEE1620946.1 polyprenyl synthetase family protein [Zafaria sp. J156]